MEYPTTRPKICPNWTPGLPGTVLIADLWGHPVWRPTPLLDNVINSVDSNREVIVDNIELLSNNDDVLRLEVEMSNAKVMHKSNALEKLLREGRIIRTQQAKCECKLERHSFGKDDECPGVQAKSVEEWDCMIVWRSHGMEMLKQAEFVRTRTKYFHNHNCARFVSCMSHGRWKL